VFCKNDLMKKAFAVSAKLSFTINLPSVAGVKTGDCHW